MQLQQAGLVIVLFIGLVLLSQRRSYERKRKLLKGPPPKWAGPYLHLVPEWLRNGLNWYDWDALRVVNASRVAQHSCEIRSPVVLSLTSSPKRIKYVPFVLSLLDLGCVTRIEINLPRQFGRTRETYSELPRELVEHKLVKICWQEEDWGPIMKILPTVERAQKAGQPSTICISIDDDICYPRDLVFALARASEACQGKAVVGHMGAPLREFLRVGKRESFADKFYSLARPGPTNCAALAKEQGLLVRDMIEGFGGVAYRASQLDIDKCLAMTRASSRCFKSDDIVLSMALETQGVCRFRLAKSAIKGFSFGDEEDALHVIQNHNRDYAECIDSVAK